jgi:hypothetical protein
MGRAAARWGWVLPGALTLPSAAAPTAGGAPGYETRSARPAAAASLPPLAVPPCSGPVVPGYKKLDCSGKAAQLVGRGDTAPCACLPAAQAFGKQPPLLKAIHAAVCSGCQPSNGRGHWSTASGAGRSPVSQPAAMQSSRSSASGPRAAITAQSLEAGVAAGLRLTVADPAQAGLASTKPVLCRRRALTGTWRGLRLALGQQGVIGPAVGIHAAGRVKDAAAAERRALAGHYLTT